MLKILPQFYYFILLLYSVIASADILAALAALVDVCSALLKPPSLHRASNETGFPGPRMKQFSYLVTDGPIPNFFCPPNFLKFPQIRC